MIPQEFLFSAIGVVGSAFSAWLGWIFGRKRQNAEIANMQLEYLTKMDRFYNDTIDKLRQDIFELNEKDRIRTREMLILRSLVTNIVNDVCLKKGCAMRIFYSQEELDEIISHSAIPNMVDTNNKKEE